MNSLCLAHFYLKLAEYTLYLDPVYNCTVILFSNLCTNFATPSYNTVQIKCTLDLYTCPILLLVLVLTNGIPSKITLMNRVDQSQGSKCMTHKLIGQMENTPALRAVGLEKAENLWIWCLGEDY